MGDIKINPPVEVTGGRPPAYAGRHRAAMTPRRGGRVFRRLTMALGALFMAVFLTFTLSGPANADNTFGLVSGWTGWNYYHSNCLGGDTWFNYQGYRATSDTASFKFQAGEDGIWRITPSAGPYREWHILGNSDVLSAPIYGVHWTSIANRYQWWIEFYPSSGGGCSVYLGTI